MNAKSPVLVRAGFSIVELLTTITIMSVMASLVAHVSQESFATARQMQCASNLRQLVNANYMYASEHGGFFSPASDVTNRIRWHGKRTSTSGVYDVRMGYLSPYFCNGEGIAGTPRSASFNKETIAENWGGVLECKEFTNYSLSSSSFEKGAGCYGYNSAYIGGQTGDMFNPASTDALDSPSTTIMFADTAFAVGKNIQEYPFVEPFYYINARGQIGAQLTPSLHFRHNGEANVAWADGHVTSETPSRLANRTLKIGWIGDDADNGFWNSHQTHDQ